MKTSQGFFKPARKVVSSGVTAIGIGTGAGTGAHLRGVIRYAGRALVHFLSATHVDRLTSDEACVVGCEKGAHCGGISGLANPF